MPPEAHLIVAAEDVPLALKEVLLLKLNVVAVRPDTSNVPPAAMVIDAVLLMAPAAANPNSPPALIVVAPV